MERLKAVVQSTVFILGLTITATLGWADLRAKDRELEKEISDIKMLATKTEEINKQNWERVFKTLNELKEEQIRQGINLEYVVRPKGGK